MNKSVLRSPCTFLLSILFFCSLLSSCTSSSEVQPSTTVDNGIAASSDEMIVFSSSDDSQSTIFGKSSHTANEALNRLNHDLDYSTYYYSAENPKIDGKENLTEPIHNLTDTRVSAPEDSNLAIGWLIIANEEELATFEQLVSDVEATRLKEKQKDNPELDHYALLSEPRKTANIDYNSEFFQRNSLLVVDMGVRFSARAYFYPENLEVDGETVRLDIRWDHDNSYNGNASQLCLIVIPTGCTTAELNLIHDPGE